MDLKNITTNVTFDEIWMLPVQGDLRENSIGRLVATDTKGLYYFYSGENPAMVNLRDMELSMDLDFHLRRGCAHLAQVIQQAQDNSVMLKAVFFRTSAVEMDEVETGIDTHIENTARRYEQFGSLEDLAKKLQEKCIITDGKHTWFIIKTGATAKEDFGEAGEEAEPVAARDYAAFSICGDGLTIPVKRQKLDEISELFFATKIVYQDTINGEGALTLVKGNLVFSSIPKRVQAITAAVLRKLEEQGGSYLVAWDRYGDEQYKLLIEKAVEIGSIAYIKTEKESGGVRCFVAGGIPKTLGENDELELVKPDELPPYLVNPEMTWEEYQKILEAEYLAKKDKPADENSQVSEKNEGQENAEEHAESAITNGAASEQKIDIGKRSFKILDIQANSILLDMDIAPPANYVLILSIIGDKSQFERQLKARQAVRDGRSANSLLGLIIEEGGVLPEIQRTTTIKPLSRFVEEKIFSRNPPTPRQIEAIEMALNTPGITLIQGPPGTGKTTVITAILERLNEEYDKKNSIRGKILVSGFQHDAVENIVSRLSVNSLPAVKFGRRSGESEETETTTQLKIDQWVMDIREKLLKAHPEIRQLEEQQKLQALFRQYAVTPAKNIAKNILDLILSLSRTSITEDIVSEATNIYQTLKSEVKSADQTILAVIRALRTTEETFVDDGSRNAHMALGTLEKQLSPKETDILQQAASWKQGRPLDFLKELASLQESLLNASIPRPEFSVEKPREEILTLITKVNDALSRTRSRGSKKGDILARFLNELETNPQGIREAIEDYNFVYAATTQGAEGKDIRRAKTKDAADYVRYDTVIIDEAARVSPRDLLIPMAQAEKRIILVGDHRQLPQIIEEEIIRRAIEGKEKTENEHKKALDEHFEYYIKISMFEYLKQRLEALYLKDNIKRTVTLDKQYRTHPLLGNFVNKHFYAPYQGESFESPLGEEFFRQRLPGLDGRPAMWINVSGAKGNEEQAGISRIRRQEAEAIARQLKKWIDCEEGKNLTFGIISFYRAQCDLVFEELGKPGIDITERASTKEPWKIKETYRLFTKEEHGKKKTEERLRIGTVDAFQGMEFDVVFLSMVRSPRHIPKGKQSEQVQARTFGRLMSPNLLCVGMSRQKKALVVAGDAGLIQSEIAGDAVPALADFYDLCKAKGKLYEF